MLFHYLWVAFIGLIVGCIAEAISPGKHPGGCITTSLIGIAGSIFFGFVSAHFLHGFMATWPFIGSILGTVVLLALFRAIFGKNA